MEENDDLGQDHQLPPQRLFERLAQLSGYTWDQSIEPFHSSYENWHVFGIQHRIADKSIAQSSVSYSSKDAQSSSTRSSPRLGPRPSVRHYDTGSEIPTEVASSRSDRERSFTPVIARVSRHVLRLEREYHLGRSFIQTSDPECNHTVRLIDLIILPGRQGDPGPLAIEIFESPGRNYLRDLTDFGPAFYTATAVTSPKNDQEINFSIPKSRITLTMFLDFAIGASECLELLHHGLRVMHGELRADAFHFNQETGVVKLVNFGSGPRSFEHAGGLSSTGWSALSRQAGIKNRLRFIAPEQTGRMPAEPDSRTDIYSLGILFWTMLARQPAFDGNTPMDIMQAVLGRRLVPISTLRYDVPEMLSRIIQKMTQKQIDERYHSTSGLKYDLSELRRLLGEGDVEALKRFEIGSRDVSSFFMLPTSILGRSEERRRIVHVMEKVAMDHHTLQQPNSVFQSITSTSASTISDRAELVEVGTRGSDSSSQAARESESSPAFKPVAFSSEQNPRLPSNTSESLDVPPTVEKPPLDSHPSKDSVETTITVDSQATGGTKSSQWSRHSNAPICRWPKGSKFARRRRCEIITIYGSAGLGKSSLIQSTQNDVRKLGYFASAKFDPANKAPFEPMLRFMSSLFRQIFSESDVNTAYHNNVRASIRPFWQSVRGMLDLPDHLISTEPLYTAKNPPTLPYNKALRVDITDAASSYSSHSGSQGGSQGPSDFLRGGANSRSTKILSTFLEVLRILSATKLICVCLDDLQYADEESMDLISSIITRKLGIVLIITCREPEQIPVAIRSLLDHNSTANLTTLSLRPLGEEQIVDFIVSTLHRSHDYVLPLAMVCLEKTNGNPFYLRQMLEVCYRKGCIWYSWKDSVWEYDLDRVFAEFEAESYGVQLNTSFILKRLQDLPAAAREILAWGSLLGNTFSFGLVKRLLEGEYDYPNHDTDLKKAKCIKNQDLYTPQPIENAVEGLQAALQAYILMPSEDEDKFSFSHDRYVQASASLRECQDVPKMHFRIAQTMMKYSRLDNRSLYAKAQHVCQAAAIIKLRVQHRNQYRELLFQAAQRAVESGARPTALQFYKACVDLMQPKPWTDGPDVYYEETLDVYARTAELYWHQGRFSNANSLVLKTLEGARTPSDRAPSWIIKSRLLSQQGNIAEAFAALKTSLMELRIDCSMEPNVELLDIDFNNLQNLVNAAHAEHRLQKSLNPDPRVVSLGAVLIEAISAAFWSDAVLFYQLVNKIVEAHINHPETFSQIGLGFSYFSIISIIRQNDVAFAIQCMDIAQDLMNQFKESYTFGRGLTLKAMFIEHFRSPIREHISVAEEAIEHSLVSGDKHLFLLSVGFIASCRLFQGEDMAEIDNYCSLAAEDFGDWSKDLRGGTYLTAVRQVSRALQGKTWYNSADTVMSDMEHSTAEYMDFVAMHASNPERPRDMYHSFMMIPLYLFGHYEYAIQIGTRVCKTIDQLWSIRNNRLTLFYLSLAILAYLRENPSTSDYAELRARVCSYKIAIDAWQTASSVNYLMWSLLIEAELAEIDRKYHEAILCFETAIDHTQLYDFMLEQALTFELQGEFFIRRGSKRAARNTLLDSIALFQRIGASGKAEQLRSKHELFLSTAKSIRTTDAGVQTASSIGDIGNMNLRIQENDRQQSFNLETANDRTKAWISPSRDIRNDPDVSGLGLDVLDLQSILEFNQAISSELQIDRLLAKMTEIILESAGAQADFAGIVIESEGGWEIAVSGTADGIVSEPLSITELGDETQKQVLLYTMRFKEIVFVHNVLHDERFCNTLSTKSVISLPIIQGNDLLGVLYLEGQPNSFTDRNLGVLQLFCNQVAISIANALLFRRIRKVSAANTSMIETQKRALAHAREAEIKAKLAEAEALKNVKLKEEAAKAKSMFLANVSHELRTPLNGVIGMSELLKETNLSEVQDGYADSIRVCADTLLTVINDILDFSKLEAQKMKLDSLPLNLKQTITEVVRALSHMNSKKGLQTLEHLDLDENLLVLGDQVRLHQILMNLLSNGYKFTAKGSITVRARTDHEDQRSIRLTCSIIDTGIGITQEQLSRLFEPFSQADSSTQRSYGGSGLGLSICKALIDVLNGKIWLESQLGVGTTVSFTLTFAKARKAVANDSGEPLAREPDPMATWSSDPARLTTSSSASSIDLSKIPRDQLRICIAEDNPINQKIAVSFVAKLGIKSEAFSDGLQAVEALRLRSSENRPFHLVLMDVQMPVLDGYDATRLIRKDEDPTVRSVLVIAMTASAIRGDREKCLEAGMNNYLAKPVKAAVLKTMLEDYLNQTPRQIPDLQTKANGFAKQALSESSKEIAPAAAAASKPSRPTFTRRMNSRNSIPFLGDDPISKPLSDDAPRNRPPFLRGQSSGGNSSDTVTEADGRGRGDLVDDRKIPTLSLLNRVADAQTEPRDNAK